MEANYTDPIPSYGDLILLEEFIGHVKDGNFIDYDGHGNPSRDGRMDGDIRIYPSKLYEIPQDCTHIVWYNR